MNYLNLSLVNLNTGNTQNMKTHSIFIFLISLLMLISSNIFASEKKHHHKHDHNKQTIIIEQAQARETPPGAKVGAGYLKITNTSKTADTLVSVSGDIAPIIEIHTMTQIDNTIRMEQLKDGVTIPAGETIKLAPGGKHLMFLNLQNQLKAGELYKVTLRFAKAGEIIVDFPVKKVSTDDNSNGAHHNHSNHQHNDQKKQHSKKHHHH